MSSYAASGYGVVISSPAGRAGRKSYRVALSFPFPSLALACDEPATHPTQPSEPSYRTSRVLLPLTDHE